jgi:hypothetical protein
MIKTKYFSWKLNNLTAGCNQCILGRKLVVFVTGICPKDCFYCPLSEQKKNNDVIFANERPLRDEDDIDALIDEAALSKSWGAGLTGGDPLARIDRTCKYIKILKREFGKKYHIHLYTVLESLNNERLKKLEIAGLDELRMHPDILNNKDWDKMKLLYVNGKRKYKYGLGVEIPSIPGYEKETIRLIDYFIEKIDFLNINELEISDTNSSELLDRKFHTKDKASYAVKGSQELAFKLLGYIGKKYSKANVHYCTCKLKDGVQLKERLRIRAKSSHKKFDIVTEDGTLIRGAIYAKELSPSYSYKSILADLDPHKRDKIISKLKILRNNLIKNYAIPKDMIILDDLKIRIITNIGIARNLAKVIKPKFIPAIVEQYPTYDQMEVDVEFL